MSRSPRPSSNPGLIPIVLIGDSDTGELQPPQAPPPTRANSPIIRHSFEAPSAVDTLEARPPHPKRKRDSFDSNFLMPDRQGKGKEIDRNSEATMYKSSKSESSSKSQHKSKKDRKEKADDWSEITDPDERRRVQNRLPQRKFREKTKERKESASRQEADQKYASGSYSTIDPSELGEGDNLSGLPWGSFSMRHVLQTGRAKESESRRDERAQSSTAYSYYDYEPSSQYGSGGSGSR